jgi:hypothetical protein
VAENKIKRDREEEEMKKECQCTGGGRKTDKVLFITFQMSDFSF